MVIKWRLLFPVLMFIVVAQWISRLTRNISVVGSNPNTCSCCFLEKETLPSLLSTALVQKRIIRT